VRCEHRLPRPGSRRGCYLDRAVRDSRIQPIEVVVPATSSVDPAESLARLSRLLGYTGGVGVRVNQARLDVELARRGLTASALAKAAGLSEATLSHARTGRPVRPLTLTRIAATLARIPTILGIDDLVEGA
jgi:DNA-binding Xre family transcriptional regulator